ncbi:c6 finger domain [Fusarium albosuccineum]|uniref:C6 finger domain n=1 Tax=Fusarium albosuccineum TaxID=1237068 RepID=A0A8H4L457_9HYPO|nr:c6 finger domain [Fusarium albosuccineum]
MNTAPPRPTRSKNGCNTCRNRKVRWRPRTAATTRWKIILGPEPGCTARLMDADAAVSSNPAQAPQPDAASVGSTDSPGIENPGVIDQMFDYASFMWDTSDVMGPFSPETDIRINSFDSASPSMNRWSDTAYNPAVLGTKETLQPTTNPHKHQSSGHLPHQTSSTRNGVVMDRTTSVKPVEDCELINYFVRSVLPPILAEVETQKRWSDMRQVIVSMSNASSMVRYSVLAFTNLLYCRGQASSIMSPSHYYQHALKELVALENIASGTGQADMRKYCLATIFFLCYVDIIDDRVESAHIHLKRAFNVFQAGRNRGFRPVEARLLSWIRRLDARAVSAGGEGLFLSDASESLVEPSSPGRLSDTDNGEIGPEERLEWDVEDVLFQVLYQPGIIFFQKVQSFMGRISKIDPWHRSRGTVEDEMEVMQVASRILSDLRRLYEDRPALMDHAVQGKLTAHHISANLATAITRAFRTYLSNYHASKIHLHRVAYKHLPLSRESTEALAQIRCLTRLMIENLQSGTVLPVSQLWPLLMLGSEEEEPAERAWINEQILKMKNVATNTKVTAHVLREVQARQDASKARVDIRSVMHDVYDSCFAIL